jgi:crossover junction endodeoxyribonuclease RusA
MIRLVLPYPPSVNTYWRHVQGRPIVSRAGREYRQQVVTDIAARRRQDSSLPARLQQPLAVTLRVHAPDRRARDLDNLPKALLDAITHAGLWEDDSLIDELHIYRCGPIKGGCVVVQIDYSARELAA